MSCETSQYSSRRSTGERVQDTCSLQRSTLPVLWKTVALFLGSGQTFGGSKHYATANRHSEVVGKHNAIRDRHYEVSDRHYEATGGHRVTEAWHQILSIGLWHPSLPTRAAITGYDTDLRKLSAHWQFSVGAQTTVSL